MCISNRLALFAIAGLALAATPTMAQVNNPEIEGNDNKAGATVAASGGAGMANGDFITGTSTSASGVGLDYFRVKTAAAPLGIYRHRLLITSGTPGHTGSIRGLTQTNGVINTTSDSGSQSSSATSSPARFNQWYGFGKGEEIFYRVAGAAATTSSYTSTLETTPVTPDVVSTPIAAGQVTVTTINQGHTTDTDFWVYDSNFNPVPTFGNDEESLAGGGTGATAQSICRRPLTPGRYYIAIGAFNTLNNQASPADDDDPNYSVLDFPDAILCGNTAGGLNVSLSIIHSGGTVAVPVIREAPYGVAFVQFDVVPPTNPGGAGTATPAAVNNCGTNATLLTFVPTPGSNPASTSYTVTADIANLDFSQGLVSLTDDGLNGDVTANDGTFSRSVVVPNTTLAGPTVVPVTVTDDLNRSSTSEIAVNVLACPPANDRPAQSFDVVIGTPVNGTTIGAGTDDDLPSCNTPNSSPGVWYRLVGNGNTLTADTCASAVPFDTKLTVYCGQNGVNNLSCILGNDDTTACSGNLSSVTFCSEPGAIYYIQVHGFGGEEGDFTLTVTDSNTPCNNPIACLPAGRCCLPDTSCAIVTQVVCASQGGTYGGDGTDCLNSTARFSSTDTFPIAIPDGTGTIAQSTIVIPPGSGTAQNLAVAVGLNHTWIGDIIMTIDNGTTEVTLLFFTGDATGLTEGDSSNVAGRYVFADVGADFWAAAAAGDTGFTIPPGVYAPSDELTGALPVPSLAIFDGTPLEGTWTLSVGDAVTIDSGTITSFTLINGFTPANPCAVADCFVDFNDDGFLNQEDLGGFLTAFLDESIPAGPSGTNSAPCPGQAAPYDLLGFAADYNRDCNFDQEDLGGYITEFFTESENPVNCIPG